MSKSDSAVKPFKQMDGEPVFNEAWQAQLLAMVDQMINDGIISNTAWSQTLGDNLSDSSAAGKADDIETYYAAALAAFETLLAQLPQLSVEEVDNKQKAWEQAYLATPHGQPVVLKS